jgi:hypothetical protein
MWQGYTFDPHQTVSMLRNDTDVRCALLSQLEPVFALAWRWFEPSARAVCVFEQHLNRCIATVCALRLAPSRRDAAKRAEEQQR